MRSIATTAGLMLVLGLAACSTPPQMGSQMTAPPNGSASEMPQTANSLPRGDVVNAPRASSTGTVGVTRTY